MIEYNGFFIDFNVYKKNEYSIQINGDDIIFYSLDDAKKYIDNL